MKIGILTQPLINNYGGILQNFALQTILKKMGHQPTTINIEYHEPVIPWHTRFLKLIWRAVKKIKGDKSIVFCDVLTTWRLMNIPGKEQKCFIESNISFESYSIHPDSAFLNEKSYDALIVGSDQVWRPRFSPNITSYFLDFAEGYNVKRLSYAASFGTDSWEGTSEETPGLAYLARLFDAISVREKSGVDVCKKTFGVDATWVLDPTMLLKKKDYQTKLNIEEKVDHSLAVYVLDITPKLSSLINRISKEKNLKVNIIGRPTRNGFPSIESWLSGIFNSDFVLTDSFHGTVFSILAHKQFATVVNVGRGASRFESLLGTLGLMDRVMSDDKAFNDTIIDYDMVEEKLHEYRLVSMDFLNNALK